MDIGLYNAKYAVRKLISGVLPLFKDVNPNTVSWILLPIGALTAFSIYAAETQPWLYLAAIVLVFARMFFGTLDGYMAVQFNKSSPWGEIVNRLAPELCDLMYMGTLVLVNREILIWGILALLLAWLTTFLGLVGATIGKPTHSVGPVGQTDKLTALQVFCLLEFLSIQYGWGTHYMHIFIQWIVIGGIITVSLRLWRNYRAVKS